MAKYRKLIKTNSKTKKIVLWLAKSQFPNGIKSLPKKLLNLQRRGLTIEFCDDIKSFKKFLYSAKKYNNYIIITADDDVIYPNNWLENLYKTYLKNKHSICCYRAHEIKLNSDFKPAPYKDWDLLQIELKEHLIYY